jgi:long-chain fatty acid transport protein
LFAAILATSAFFASSIDAEAGGFFVREQSTSAMGSAFAGASAVGNDPSNLYFNPALIADQPGNRATIDARAFFPEAEINADSAT